MRPSYVLLHEITSKYEDDDMQRGIGVKTLCSENSNSGKAAVLCQTINLKMEALLKAKNNILK